MKKFGYIRIISQFCGVKKQISMKFELSDLTKYFGRDNSECKGRLYSVILENEEDTQFEQFLAENGTLYNEEINEIWNRLTVMVQNTGFRREYFKHKEGSLGDGVAALRQGQLRLYIYYHDRTAIIVGSGGYKPPEIRAYQEDRNLNAKADLMKRIAKAIANAIIERDLTILEDGSIETTDFLDLEI